MAKQPKKVPPGPDPMMLKLEGPWTRAADKALEKKKPPGGWPKVLLSVRKKKRKRKKGEK